MKGLVSASYRFLLTPLREGRHVVLAPGLAVRAISTHAPAGGATRAGLKNCIGVEVHFYSRPCGRGDNSGLP